MCNKHFNPYETYCPICHKHLCSYCSVDHDEKHVKDEYTLKKQIIKEKYLNQFKDNN